MEFIYSWPLNSTEVRGADPRAVKTPGITFDSPQIYPQSALATADQKVKILFSVYSRLTPHAKPADTKGWLYLFLKICI